MGDYSPNQQFYLTDPSELVDVEQHVNYNFRRADERVRPLVEYQITSLPSISDSDLTKDTGFKWYKTYSNSIYHWRDGAIFQDANATVGAWSFSNIVFASTYTSFNSAEGRIGYMLDDAGIVHWRGKLAFNAGSALPANVATKFLVPPSGYSPNRARYFTVYGGDSTGDFQCYRIFIPDSAASDKSFEFCKYGGNGTTTGENYISLNDIHYPLSDA